MIMNQPARVFKTIGQVDHKSLIMKKLLLITSILSGISVAGFSQSYQSWLDSIKNPDYIANEYLLEEIVFHQTDSSKRYVNDLAMTRTDDILERSEGVWMIKRGAYAAEPVIRGLSGNRVLVTFDGMRIKGACTDKMDPTTSYIEPNNLEKIESTNGNLNAMNGSNIGGNLNFKIKKPVYNSTTPFSGKFETKYNAVSHGMENAFLMNYSKSNIAVIGGFTYRKNENYRDGKGNVIENSGFNKVNYNLSISHKSNQSLLNLSYIGDRAWDIGYPALPMDVAHANADILSMEYSYWPTSGIWDEYSIKLYHNQIDHLMDDSNRDVEVRMDMPGKSQSTGGYFIGKKSISDKWTFDIKGDVNYSILNAEMTMFAAEAPPMYMLTWPKIETMNSGFAGSSNYQFNSNWNINSIVRIEFAQNKILSDLGKAQFSVFGYSEFQQNYLLPTASLQLKRTNAKNTYVAWDLSYSERAPDESEQYGFYLYNNQDGYDYLGNPFLDKERSFQMQLSTGLSTKYINLNAHYFNYIIKDYIMAQTDPALSAMTPGAMGVRIYENEDMAFYQGFECSFTASFNQWNMASNAKYTHASLKSGGPLPLIPPIKWMNRIEYRSKFGLSLQAELNYSAGQYRVNKEYNEDTTHDFLIINLHLQQSLLKNQLKKLVIQAGVDNLTNMYYHEHLDWNNIPRPGRNIYGGLKLWF